MVSKFGILNLKEILKLIKKYYPKLITVNHKFNYLKINKILILIMRIVIFGLKALNLKEKKFRIDQIKCNLFIIELNMQKKHQ